MGTRPVRFGLQGLREITIRMYATHRSTTDPSEVSHASDLSDEAAGGGFQVDAGWSHDDGGYREEDGGVAEVTIDDGSIFQAKKITSHGMRHEPLRLIADCQFKIFGGSKGGIRR